MSQRDAAPTSGEARSPHRAWIEIDHAAIRHNIGVLRGLAPESQVIGVVKANAYGHGDVAVARTLTAAGVERLAVATVWEARRLREAGIVGPVMLLWGIGPADADDALALDTEPMVADLRAVELVERTAATSGRRASVHLKVDTGLGRQGATPEAAAEIGLGVLRSRHLSLAGTFTHLAVPGEDDAYTEVQLLRLARALDAMRSAGVDPGLVHVAATGAILAGNAGRTDAIRPGLGLYGLVPDWAAEQDPGLRPALALKALPLRIFDLPAGTPIGYGLRYTSERPTRIATLGIGYGDGWPRIHVNNGRALVRGQMVPMVGAISMDGLTVDCGVVDDVTYEDEFILIGEQGGSRITVDEVAAERRTINYEVTTALRDRLPRLHLGTD